MGFECSDSLETFGVVNQVGLRWLSCMRGSVISLGAQNRCEAIQITYNYFVGMQYTVRGFQKRIDNQVIQSIGNVIQSTGAEPFRGEY